MTATWQSVITDHFIQFTEAKQGYAVNHWLKITVRQSQVIAIRETHTRGITDVWVEAGDDVRVIHVAGEFNDVIGALGLKPT